MVLQRNAVAQQTPGIPLVPGQALHVVAFKDAPNAPVAPGHQVLHRVDAPLAVVHGHRDAALQGRVIAVEKHHRDAHFLQFFIQVQIGVGQGAFGALHNQAVHPLFHVVLQNAPLVVHPVLGGREQGEEPLLGELPLDAPHNGRENVLADVGGHHPHVPRALPAALHPAHIGAAALAALDKALLLQQRKGLAHGLAAHGKLPRHLVFPRQALAVLVLTLEDAPFQLLKKMDILCLFFHRNDLPSPGVPSTLKLYLHLLYLHFTGLSGRCQGKTPGTARGS